MNNLFTTKRTLPVKKEIAFLRQLGFLLDSGMPLLMSLTVLKKEFSKNNSGVEEVAKKVSAGVSFSTALKELGFLSSFSIYMLAIGERSGCLAENARSASYELAKKTELKRKLLSAFLYPCFILLATICLSVFLVAYIFPKIIPLFASMHAALPFSTQIILFLYDFGRLYGLYLFVVAFVGVIICIFFYKKNVAIRLFIEKLVLKIPIIGSLLRTYLLATFLRTLRSLLLSGMSIPESLSYVALITEHRYSRQIFSQAAPLVSEGKTLSQSLSGPDLFHEMTLSMISIGESSGNLNEVLKHVSEVYENDFNSLIKDLPTILEPTLMVVIGLVVGFIALSIITPIYAITQNLKL